MVNALSIEPPLLQSSFGSNNFIENKGQMLDMDGRPVPFVLFKQESKGMNFYITEKGLTYVFQNWRKELKQELSEAEKLEAERTGKAKKQKFIDWSRIDMELAGADIRKENIIAEQMSSSFSQYFLGHCPDGIKNVRTYGKVTIKNVYPGIDWVFYNSSEKGVKYDFIVHPGADIIQVKLLYRSKEKLDLDTQGNIQIKTAYGVLTENAPETFQNGKLVESKFKIISQSQNDLDGFDNLIAIDLPELGLSGTGTGLRIDPQLYWATFFGGSGFDGPRSVTTDNSGNVFVTGYTESMNFPTQSGSGYYQGTAGGGVRDMFFQKFTNTGVRLWATYYGGNLTDEGWHVTTDNSGNVFIIGYSESANLPTQNAGTFFQGTYGGQGDAVILKFDNNGNRLWATYYGGVSMEEGFGITTDPNGNIFLTGETRSTATFPLQNPGGGAFFQGTYGTGTSDAFILKFDNAGNRLWSTYAGGWNTDMGNAITTDAAGNVFVTGYAWGGGFPVLNSGTFYQGAVTGSGDAFIMKFSNNGTLLWSTYYGGGAVDEGNSIAVDANGNVFVTGTTASPTFPVLNAAGAYFKGTKSGTWDTYLLKFDNLGNRLWATFFGGSGFEAYKEYTFDNLAIDDCGNVYMTVETESTDVPTQASCDNGYFDNSYNGGAWDIFVTQFSNVGAYLWGTYLGGDGDDFRSPIALDAQNNLFISGEWTDNSPLNPATYPLTNPGGGSYNSGFSGGHDGIMVKFEKVVPVLTTSVVNATCGCTGSATANPSGICSPFTYQWSNGQTTQTITGLCAGTYSVTVANSLCGVVTNNSVTITVANGFTLTPTSAPAACLLSNGTATVTTTGGTAPFTYAWSPSGGSSSAATGLAPGNYIVIVTDGNGCTGTSTVVISSSGGPAVALANQTNVSCNGGANGGAVVTVSSGTSPYTYSWSPAGGSAATASGLNAGTYTVTVTDSNGCPQTQTVTITQPAALSSTINSTSATCQGNNGTAAVSLSGGTAPYTYSWTPAGGTTATATGLATGTVTVTMTDANGCVATNSVTVAFTGSVTAAANNSTICAGQTATLVASGGSSYLWSNGQSTSAISVSPVATTTYSVVVSNGSCSDTTTATVTVSAPPAASAGNNQTVCVGSVVTLTASGGGTYQWSTGASTAVITSTATAATTYSVLVTNSFGCTATASVNIFTTPSIVANAGPDQTICLGGVASLSASGGTGYNWSPSSGLSNPGIFNPVATPGSTTTYTVTVTSGSCSPANAVVTVVVTPGPIAAVASSVTINSGQNVTLSASGGGTYTWSNGDSGSPVIVTPTVTTLYCVTVTDAIGCSDTACVTVYIEPVACSSVSDESAFMLPSAFSPNGDGQNDKWRLLYPLLLADCIAEFHVAVYSRWGELVFEGFSIAFSWDGIYNEKAEGTAVFAYYMNATMKDGTKISKKGNLSLLR